MEIHSNLILKISKHIMTYVRTQSITMMNPHKNHISVFITSIQMYIVLFKKLSFRENPSCKIRYLPNNITLVRTIALKNLEDTIKCFNDIWKDQIHKIGFWGQKISLIFIIHHEDQKIFNQGRKMISTLSEFEVFNLF